MALCLGGLRRRIEALMVPDSVDVVLQLDGLAECERRRRPSVGAAKQNCAAANGPPFQDQMSALGGSGRAAPKEEVGV